MSDTKCSAPYGNTAPQGLEEKWITEHMNLASIKRNMDSITEWACKYSEATIDGRDIEVGVLMNLVVYDKSKNAMFVLAKSSGSEAVIESCRDSAKHKNDIKE